VEHQEHHRILQVAAPYNSYYSLKPLLSAFWLSVGLRNNFILQYYALINDLVLEYHAAKVERLLFTPAVVRASLTLGVRLGLPLSPTAFCAFSLSPRSSLTLRITASSSSSSASRYLSHSPAAIPLAARS
jgi:hypothetical protein